MKFTLYTSFHNGENYVESLYEKIKLQTYKNWEWVITDDFSKDNTKQKLIDLSFSDRRIKYVEQSKKKEMFFNPQKFCEHADIIVQLDQDDFPLPKALEVYHHFFTKFPEVSLITSAANMYNEDGGWRNFHNIDFRNENNMSCGKLTILRAWRNNPDIRFDFNPNDWRKYFWADLAIICGVEEYGKVLVLPRNLYYVSYREGSISREKQTNIDEVREENSKLINGINNRRYDKDMDTIIRYFDPIFDLSHSFMSHDLNNTTEQVKISYHLNTITSHQKKLLKELYFDYDLNINDSDGDEDCLIWCLNTKDDFQRFLDYKHKDSFEKTMLVIPHFYKVDETHRNEMVDLVKNHYRFFFQVGEHMVLTLLK